MNLTSNIPTTITLSFLVLTGWVISDFRMNDAVNTALVAPSRLVSSAQNVVMEPATTTPNIDTNWFAGSNSQGASFQVPASQARKSDDDERVAVGGTMGESFGNNDDY